MRTGAPTLTLLVALVVLVGCSNPYTTKPTITPIYAATAGGLSLSIDGGRSWTTYTSADGLSSSTANSVWVSGSGHEATVYVGTSNGFSVYNGATWTSNTSVLSASNPINAIAYDGYYVWAGTGTGLAYSSDGGTTWSQINAANGPGTKTINDLFILGSPYAATSSGLYVQGVNGWGVVGGMSNNNLNTVFVDQNGSIYAGSTTGLEISIDGGSTWKPTTFSSTNIRSLFVDQWGYIYVGTSGGLSISGDGGTTWTTYTTADGLGSDTVNGIDVVGNSIYLATAGGVSISTDFGGTWNNYSTATSTGLASNTINAIYVTEPLYSF